MINFRCFLPNDMAKKNNIDENYRMQMSPQMRQMFSNPDDSINGNSQITYQNITIKDVKTRTITNEEYQHLPNRAKSILFHLPYFMMFVFGILVIMLIICLLNNLDTLEGNDFFFMIFGIIVFALAIVWAVKEELDARIKPNSQIADGTILFLNREYTLGPEDKKPIFFATVALHNQQAYVKRVKCSRKNYYKLGNDSKVYLLVKGRKGYVVPVE